MSRLRACTQPGECLAATTLGYDPQGRLETIIRGTGPGARVHLLDYDDVTQRLEDVTDLLERVVGFGYDLADRVTTLTLPATPRRRARSASGTIRAGVVRRRGGVSTTRGEAVVASGVDVALPRSDCGVAGSALW